MLLTSAKKLVCIRFLFISSSLMFISQISAADWGQAETTYNLYEVLFKVHKVSYEKDAVMCLRAVQILITSLLSLKMFSSLSMSYSDSGSCLTKACTQRRFICLICEYREILVIPSTYISCRKWNNSVPFPQYVVITSLHYSCGWQRTAGSRQGSTWDWSILLSRTRSLCASVFWSATARATPSG